MNRLQKLLAAATLLVLPVIAACGEDPVPPPATGSIMGQVSIEGMGIDGVSVNLSNGASTTTAGGGTYRFDGVEAGAYTVTISGFPADASFDATSAAATIPPSGGSVTLDFRGSYIRTASIMGTVTVENTGIGGITVRLSGMADAQTATDNNGQYAFTGLRAGSYGVEISGFDMDEVGFGSVSSSATVGVGESKIISFDGTYLRTAGIMGQVSVEGVGLEGVTVTMTGEGEDETDVTDAGGLYGFSKLKAGDYSVAISGFDPDEVEFSTTSMNVSVALGETANIPFEGTLLRTSGISGRVSVEGMGLDDVEVALTGAAVATAMTSNGGQYAFAGLAEGTYVLNMTNPNADAFTFETTSATVVLGDAESNITNFEGTHTRTASISGVLFIDEVGVPDKMLTDGEPSITEALAPWLAIQDDEMKAMVAGLLTHARVMLRGPDLNTEHEIPINPDGTFSTGETLPAGSYQVELPANNEMVAAALAAAGVAFVGESAVVTVEAAGSAMVNFPFRITMQTVATGARMGGGGHFGLPVEGVKLALYARADGTGMLDEAETDEMGMATFNFARADDTSPGSDDGDNIVFVKAVESGHPALVVSGNDLVEIAYASTARLYAADHEKEVATLLNVAVGFDFWVKSNETARDGDEGLGGWSTAVVMVDSEDPSMTSDPLMMEDEDGEMVNATKPTNDGKMNEEYLGKSTFSYVIDPTMLGETGITFAVAAVPVVVDEDGKRTSVQPDMGEVWEQSDALVHTHTGLDLPPGEDDDMTDLGPIRITYTTQAVYVGTHRELDDRTGFTDYLGLGDGDARPSGTAEDEIEVSVMVADSRGRLDVLEYDHDMDDETDDVEATDTFDDSGIVSFAHIPADMKITIVVDAGSDMVILPDTRAATEIDAYGEQLDDFPDGVMKGAYGDGSGARPDVWICPLWRLDEMDPEDNCSTFAYKWASGTITGAVTGLRKGDEDVEITLSPVNSNDEYEDDLADDLEVDYKASTYTFTGVPDGRYEVTLAAMAGKWQEDTAKGISVMHDEDNDDDDYTGDVDGGNNLSATDLRGVIKGVIGNDANGTGSLTGSESRSGVVVNLHYAKKVGGTGANKNQRVDGGAVMDENDDPRTAETDEDGVFSFSQVAVDTVYLLKPQGTDLYTVVRNGNPGIGSTAEEATDVVPHALATVSTKELDKIDVGTPSWDGHTSMANGEMSNDFVLLYKNGEVEGTVSDPSVRAAHEHATVELRLCKTTDQVEGSEDAADDMDATKCSEYTDYEKEAEVDEDGEWLARDLMEGVWEVIVDLPAGYVHVTESGGPEDENADDADTYFSKQIAELDGGRASDEMLPFHIKDDNAGGDVGITSVLIDGDACGTSGDPWQAPDARCVDNKHDDGVIGVKVTADRGATIRLSTSEEDPKPAAPGRSVAVSNGKSTDVSLPKAGATTFYLHVAAEDGYSDNSEVTGAERDIEVRRDSDTRLNVLSIRWSGDRIDLDRRDLGLDPGNPDGETAPVTGVTTLSVQLDEGDNGADVPDDEALTIEAVGKNPAFDLVTFADLADDPDTSGEFGACPETLPDDTGTVTVEANATGTETTGKGEAAICFRITDSGFLADGTTVDSHTDNMNTYRLIMTRK